MIEPPTGSANARELPVFIKRGDARAEVDALVRATGMNPQLTGLHKTIYAAQADQTVVMVTGRDTPLAVSLRAAGWLEPRDPADRSRS